MKKSLILGLLGLAVGAASSFAQGVIMLDNYSTSGPIIVYPSGWGALSGQGLGPGWMVGLYYAQGTVLGERLGPDIPPAPFILGTGLGSTAAVCTSAYGTSGEFLAASSFLIDPYGLPGSTFTILLTVYNGVDYQSSTIRGHSSAFQMTTSAITSPSPNAVGIFLRDMFLPQPEPSTFAFIGTGFVTWLIFARRKFNTAVNHSL